MRDLILGIVDFRRRIRPKFLTKFKEMASGQMPNSLFVACSDSRVVPNLFASTNPGELFVIRNVGNLVPPCQDDSGIYSQADEAEYAAIEFSIEQLGIKNIIVCGHSDCGAMKAILQNPAVIEFQNKFFPQLTNVSGSSATTESSSCNHFHHHHDDHAHNADTNKQQQLFSSFRTPHLFSWLRHARPSLDKYRNFLQHSKSNNELVSSSPLPSQALSFEKAGSRVYMCEIDPSLSPHNQLSQINVIQQLEHICKYRLVREKVAKGEIELHGWWFDIANADVYSFSEKKQRFVLIDDAKAEELLQRIAGPTAQQQSSSSTSTNDNGNPLWMDPYIFRSTTPQQPQQSQDAAKDTSQKQPQ